MPMTVLRPVFRLFDQQKTLLIDLTGYIADCRLMSSVDYIHTLGGSLELTRKDYRIWMTGHSHDAERALYELQWNGTWYWFEYDQSGNRDTYLIGKASAAVVSLQTMNISKWDVEFFCSDVAYGRIQEEEEHKTVAVIKRGRRISREGI